MEIMEISRKEFREAFWKNDIVYLKEVWDCTELTKDSGPIVLTDYNREIVLVTLRLAAAAAYKGTLSEDIGKEVYERMADKVQLFELIEAINLAIDIDATDIRALPEWAKTAVMQDDCDTLAEKINCLTADAFAALLAFLATDAVERISNKACMPIIKRIYEDKDIVPNDLLFSLMASCLHDTAERRLAEFADPFAGLLAYGPIPCRPVLAFAFDCDDDDDENDHEKANDGDGRRECCDHPDDPTS